MQKSAVNPKKILLVEDDINVRETLTTMLENFGHIVTTAPDGRAAREALISHKFDVIIADFVMPYMNGIELFKWVKAHAAIPFFLMTSYANILPKDKAESYGITAFLAKPFKNQELLDLIQAHCK